MLKITSKIQSVQEVDSSEHNVARVNNIKVKYPEWRQESKAPTFRSDLSGNLHHFDGQLWILEVLGSDRGSSISSALRHLRPMGRRQTQARL